MYNNFIWDFDGTLIDTYPSILKCYNLIFKNHGIHEEEDRILYMLREKSSKEVIEYIEEKHGLTREAFLREYEQYSNREDILYSACPMPHAEEICKRIKQKAKRNFVITNRDETALLILEHLDMLKYFDFVMYYGRDQIAVRKPDPTPFQYVLKKFDLKSEETLSIGDRELDLVTSKKVDLPTCLYHCDYSFEIVPDYRIVSLEELGRFI